MLREDGYWFRFRSNDGGEPAHVHVGGNRGRAKTWLVPRVEVANSRGYT
ncbi:MAG TPA: DUF4160 domain-containing protein [Candidatus Limnocylindria bacterium]|nr:DUF4160 domain-containing protein [Candidatus Limnocylindria bacterium]